MCCPADFVTLFSCALFNSFDTGNFDDDSIIIVVIGELYEVDFDSFYFDSFLCFFFETMRYAVSFSLFFFIVLLISFCTGDFGEDSIVSVVIGEIYKVDFDSVSFDSFLCFFATLRITVCFVFFLIMQLNWFVGGAFTEDSMIVVVLDGFSDVVVMCFLNVFYLMLNNMLFPCRNK